jgi:hypothetical protein
LTEAINLWTNKEISDPGYYHHDLLRQLSHVFRVKPRLQEHRANGSKTHVFMMFARHLFLNQDWLKSLVGSKIMVCHDAYLNFMPESPYCGSWTQLYRNCNFDLIICSGKETTNRMREVGMPAVWVPKGCNAEFLDVPNTGNGRIGYFSQPIAEQETGKFLYFYRSRHEMVGAVAGHVEEIACKVPDFSRTISQFSAVITSDATMKEPMAKQFECSALGAVVIRDRTPELYELGYIDGESVLYYDDVREINKIIDAYKNTGLLEVMGAKAREIARKHTWAHRAEEIAKWVRHYLVYRIF